MQEKHQKRLYLAILLSESSHIFCCVLPTLFSLVSVLTGLGLMVAVPGWLVSFHDVMHEWEVPMIIASATVVALGWALYFYSKHIDCHDTGCCHEPCGPRKRTANKILVVASLLLVFNVSIYFGVHRGVDSQDLASVHEHSHE
ncbi:MAG TPA: hypothetical protein PK513_05825 [Alphaproteobacteria bacterium]|nr:hypothetical protein [Alphaproteobacteria bacterium]USO06081.1 MAG: hypothetical protein H6859_02460 [Rhodospirillales bacterium]HOO82000.1 hypothetical protein [Alphaproteobacteria bacterium]